MFFEGKLMKDRKKRNRKTGMVKRILAAALAVWMAAGSSMTAMAGRVVYDYNVGGLCCKEDDGSLAVNEWVQDDRDTGFILGLTGWLSHPMRNSPVRS